MKRTEMIKEKNEFNDLIKNGRFLKNKYFVVYYKNNDENSTQKFGIAIKNSIGNAVVRNRLKRQIRSIIDNNKKIFQNDKKYIIMIRNSCVNIKFNEMNNSIIQLLKGIKK